MSQRPRKSASRTSTNEIGTALIWIDGAPLLRDEQTKLRQTKKKLSAAEERLKLHQETDEPQYRIWFNTAFAERLGEIRLLYEKLTELDAIAWKVEREILATGCSAADAYDAVLRMIDEDSREEAQANEQAKGARGSKSDESDSSDDDEFSDFAGADNDRSGDKESEEPWKAAKSKKSASSAKKEKASDDLMKQIYRTLVRQLHPDLNPNLPEALRERWFEVQQAYEERDLARLEMLLAACEDGDDTSDDSFIDKIQSLSRLRLLLKSVAKKLRSSQGQLSQLKNQPSWEFHKLKKDPRRMSWLKTNVTFELRGAEASLLSDIRTLETQIDRWRNPSRQRSSKHQKRNKKDWNRQFDF